MSELCAVNVRFFTPPVGLRRFFTSFYQTDVIVPGDGRVTDYLHPEWGGIRILSGALPESEIGDVVIRDAAFLAQGPTSTTVRFTVGSLRMWGVGFLPLGWAKFVGVPASDLADMMVDGDRHDAFAGFKGLAATVFGAAPDVEAERARIERFFLERIDLPVADEARVTAVHDAILDSDIASVADISRRTGLPAHTLERLCRRHFGFPPQLLLRRQRFMRSIAQFMLDPSLKWIGALDAHYHDQAQFVRDFHRFMGMSPREYSAMPHPILGAVMRARFAEAGAAVQALHRPGQAAQPSAPA